jgi:hypothetical protein
MKVYRLIFKSEGGKVLFTEILEQEFSNEELQAIKWDRPILRHEIAGHIHFLALDRDYLDAMLLGVGVLQSLS